MSIEKRGKNRYLVRVYLGRDVVTGKRNFHYRTVRGPRPEAESYERKILRELDTGDYVEPSEQTLGEYLTRWLEDSAKLRISPATYDMYSASIRFYIKPSLGKIKLSKLRHLDIQAAYARLVARGLSAGTVRHAHSILSAALKQAVRWKLLRSNPAEVVTLPRQQRKEMLALSSEQAARLVRAATGSRHGLIFLIAVMTGMRPSEYLALQWKDIDLDNGVLIVRRTLIWRPKRQGWYFGDCKTDKSRRSIPLTPLLIERLRQHRRAQSEHRLKRGAAYHNLDLVFANTHGGPIKSGNLISRYFKPLLKETGLPNLRLYDLRHSCATILLAAGENPKVIAERLGHSRIATTLDTYCHVLPSMQRAASEKLEALLYSSQL